MIKKKYKYFYGPVPSWRLGSSLGIDPISAKDKICSFDCVYCQIGKTTVHTKQRKVFVPTIDRNNELTMCHNFRVGSIVQYKNCQRIVKCVNFTYSGIDTVQLPGRRVAYTLNLGGRHKAVPFDQVTLIKI